MSALGQLSGDDVSRIVAQFVRESIALLHVAHWIAGRRVDDPRVRHEFLRERAARHLRCVGAEDRS